MLIIPLLKRLPRVLRPTINRFYSYIESENEEIVEKKKPRNLKKWRNEPPIPNNSMLSAFGLEEKDKDTIFHIIPKFKDFNLSAWYKKKQKEFEIWNQRFIAERHQILGNQLAITHFVLYRGGKVRQKGVSEFLTSDDIPELPNTYQLNWVVEEIDFSDFDICYEGLDNFKDLHSLRKLSFRNCKSFDDWCLEKLFCLIPNITHLDISGCEKVTERGIEGLYRFSNLKHLTVTDYGYGAAFELTCLMLEDCIPELKVEIIKKQMTAENVQ